MKTKNYLRTSALALVGLLATAGCAKKETDAPMPRAGQTETSPTATSGLARAKEAWSAFVSRVEGGGALDPLEQYVSKATQVGNGDGTAARPMRPKYDAARPETLPKDKNGKVVSRPLPGDECPECGSGGGGYYPPAVSSTFVSSEGLALNGNPVVNPNSLITQLQLEESTSSSVGAHPGSILLNLDLNKGAGGKFIYLTFSRDIQQNSSQSQYGPFLTRIKAETSGGFRFFINDINDPDGYQDILNGNSPPNGSFSMWNLVDLNAGAGGRYIYAYQSRKAWDYSPKHIKEVGVIAGNSGSIQPPVGWERSNQDLNEGAGGDYIYLCYKYSQ